MKNATWMGSRARKLALTTHVSVSVGWLGAAASVLCLGAAALASVGARSDAYLLGTAVIWRFLIVPLSLAALATGVLLALATQWGLLRHRWVVAKLVLTTCAVVLLLLHTRSLLPSLVDAATHPAVSDHSSAGHHGGIPPRIHLVIAASGSLLLLLATTALSVFKPWSTTRFGRREPDHFEHGT